MADLGITELAFYLSFSEKVTGSFFVSFGQIWWMCLNFRKLAKITTQFYKWWEIEILRVFLFTCLNVSL